MSGENAMDITGSRPDLRLRRTDSGAWTTIEARYRLNRERNWLRFSVPWDDAEGHRTIRGFNGAEVEAELRGGLRHVRVRGILGVDRAGGPDGTATAARAGNGRGPGMSARRGSVGTRLHDPEAADAIAQGLLAWRVRRDLTQNAAARMLGVNISTLRKWENAETIPPVSIARLLVRDHEATVAEALGLPDGERAGE